MFEYIYKKEYVFRFTLLTRLGYVQKWKRMRWAGHIRRRDEIINSNKILVGTPGDKIPLERSVRKLKDNIKMYI
jgi:hypothetical protein